MKIEQHRLSIADKGDISSIWLIPEDYQQILIIAHGAGKDMNSEFISALHEGIAEQGILTVKFNFPYMEQGRKTPDRKAILEATWQCVIADVMEKTGCTEQQIFLSGKSMGGRYASMVATEYAQLGGVILFGYPLHAPGKPDKPRFEHLADISAPLLFFQGTRDSLCKLEVLQPILNNLEPKPDLHIIDGGDHSFKVLKKLNRSTEEVMAEVCTATTTWIKNR